MQLEKRYTSLNIVDQVSIAAKDLKWMATGFNQVYKEALRQKEQLEKMGWDFGQLEDLINMVEMFSFTAEQRLEAAEEVLEEYERELEADRSKQAQAVRGKAQDKACQLQH